MEDDEIRIKIAGLKGLALESWEDWPGDIGAAWELVDEMIANRKRPKIDRVAESEWRVSVDHNYCVVYDESPARAICLAYIAWKEGSSTR